MKNMAKARNISIYWFYGEPGQGRGVVDAMSSFGCKTARRCAIVMDDRWFGNAEEIKAYLEKLYEDDISKRDHIISPEETALKRKEIQEYHVLNGMRLNHMISINADI